MSAVIAATLAATTNNGQGIHDEYSIVLTSIILILVFIFVLKFIKSHYNIISEYRKQNAYAKNLKETEEQCDIAKFLIKQKAKEWNIDGIIIKDSTCFENNFIIHIRAMANEDDEIPHVSKFNRTIADVSDIYNYVYDLREIICLRNRVLEQDQTIQKFLIENDMLRNGIKKETEITIQTT